MAADPFDPLHAALRAGSIEFKRSELARSRQEAPGGLAQYELQQSLALSFASLALAGNSMTEAEAASVINDEVAVPGHSLREEMEAVDHNRAVDLARDLAQSGRPLTEPDVRTLHQVVMLRSDPDAAGRYSDPARAQAVEQLASWLAAQPDTPATAFAAHNAFLAYQPFAIGTGRVARLLMNLVLWRGGYVPIVIRAQDRPAYQAAQRANDADSLTRLLYERLDTTLSEYLVAAAGDCLPDEDG